MKAVTILGREHKFFVLRSELMQRHFASRCFDMKLRSYRSDLWHYRFVDHNLLLGNSPTVQVSPPAKSYMEIKSRTLQHLVTAIFFRTVGANELSCQP
jgi:hypothetical protein